LVAGIAAATLGPSPFGASPSARARIFRAAIGPRAQRARTTGNKTLLGSFGFHVPYARRPGRSGWCERDPPAGPGYPPVPPCRIRTTAAAQTPISPVVPAVGGVR